MSSLAASGDMSGAIYIWDLDRLTHRVTCYGHEDAVVKIIWHPHQPLLYSASIDRTVRLWDGRSARCERIFRGHSDAILDFAISSDGQMIVTGSDDTTALVFRL
jgi:WD40 repeat protein